MKPHVSAITLGVSDLERAKQFYKEGLGWPALQEYAQWVFFSVNNGASGLGLIPRDVLGADTGSAADSGAPASVTLSYLVTSEDRVEAVLAEAERAGGKIVKPAEKPTWGGVSGYFADPDGYLWKVASGEGAQAVAE